MVPRAQKNQDDSLSEFTLTEMRSFTLKFESSSCPQDLEDSSSEFILRIIRKGLAVRCGNCYAWGHNARTCKEPENPTRKIYKKKAKKKPIETDDPSTIAPNKSLEAKRMGHQPL